MEQVPRVDDGFWKGMFVCLAIILLLLTVAIWAIAMAVPPKTHEVPEIFSTEHPGVPLDQPAPPESP